MKIIFRLSEAKDKELISHIKEIKKAHNTDNRSKAMRIILQRSMEQDNLKKKIETIESNQSKVLDSLVDLRNVSNKNNQNLNSLMKGLYSIFNQNPMTFENPKNNIKNPFKQENIKKENIESKKEENNLNDEKYESILNNIDDNPLC